MPAPTPPDHRSHASRPEDVLARIDSALARIEAALARPDAGTPPALVDLRQRHSALRMAAAGALAGIDALIPRHDARSDYGPGEGESA